MTETGPSQARPGQEWQTPAWQALQALERAQDAPPIEASQEAARAEELLVQVRDIFIERLRAYPDSDQADEWRSWLDQTNAVLSMIAGIVYPTSGLRRELIADTRTALANLLDYDPTRGDHG